MLTLGETDRYVLVPARRHKTVVEEDARVHFIYVPGYDTIMNKIMTIPP